MVALTISAVSAFLLIGCASTEAGEGAGPAEASRGAPAATASVFEPGPSGESDPADQLANNLAERFVDTRACSAVPTGIELISFDPVWATGEARDYELRVQQVSNEASEPTDWSDTASVGLRVLEQSATSTTYEWRSDEVGLPPVMVYRNDSSGEFESFENLDEIRAGLVELGLASDEGEVGSGEDAEFVDAFIMEFAAQYVRRLHLLDGLELNVDEVIVDEASVPNVFGGRDFPAVQRIEIVELADAGGCVLVSMMTELDADRLLPVLAESLAVEDDVSDQDLEEWAGQVEIRHGVLGRYDFGAGLFRSITTTRFIRTGEQQRFDTEAMVFIAPEDP